MEKVDMNIEDIISDIEKKKMQIKKGKKLIYPFRYKDWIKTVELSVDGDYEGIMTDDALEIMEAIEEEKTIEEILNIFEDQCHDDWTASITRNLVMAYSKNGYPFYKATHYGKWTKRECENILKVMKENEEFDKELRKACIINDAKKEVSSRRKRLEKLSHSKK